MNMGHAVAATIHSEPNFVCFYTNTKGTCAQYGHIFVFKFVLANWAADFRVKKYVRPMFISIMVCRMFAEN